MNIKRVAGNVVWNWSGMAVRVLSGFLVAPCLLHYLGEEGYGFWIIIASLNGYAGFLDLGIRGSIGRNLAFHLARGEEAEANEVLSTGMALLCSMSLVAVLAGLALTGVFLVIFTIPPHEVNGILISLVLMSINLGLLLPLNLFDAVLWGRQRFDLLNAIDIPILVAQSALSCWCVAAGYGFVTLAAIMLAGTVATGLAKAAVTLLVRPPLRLRWRQVSRAAAGRVMGYGVWSVLFSVARMLPSQFSPPLIGARLGIELVTPFSLATRLIGFAHLIFVAGTSVLTPVAAGLHAGGDSDRQRRLFLEGGKLCAALAVFFTVGVAFLGASFIRLWVGDPVEPAPLLLLVCALGEAFALSQWITQSTLFGMGEHKILALSALAESVLVVTVCLIFTRPLGLIGISVVCAVAGTLFRGVIPALYGCRVVGMPATSYFMGLLGPSLWLNGIPALALWLFGTTGECANWLELGARVGTAIACFAAGFSCYYYRPLVNFARCRLHASVAEQPETTAL